jgi:hypothetical protein
MKSLEVYIIQYRFIDLFLKGEGEEISYIKGATPILLIFRVILF